MSATEYAFTAKQRLIMGIALGVMACFLFGMTLLAWHYKGESNRMWEQQIAEFDSHITGTSSPEKIETMRARFMGQCKMRMIATYPSVQGDKLVNRTLTSKELALCFQTATTLDGSIYDEVVIAAFNELVAARKELYTQYFNRCKLGPNVTELFCRAQAYGNVTEYNEKDPN